MTTTRVDPIFRAGGRLLVDFDPASGTEQRGRRPAVVALSPSDIELMYRRVAVCPITRNGQPRPAKVFLPPGLDAEGSILVDHVSAIDRNERILRALGFVPYGIHAEVRGKLAPFFGIRPI